MPAPGIMILAPPFRDFCRLPGLVNDSWDFSEPGSTDYRSRHDARCTSRKIDGWLLIGSAFSGLGVCVQNLLKCLKISRLRSVFINIDHFGRQ